MAVSTVKRIVNPRKRAEAAAIGIEGCEAQIEEYRAVRDEAAAELLQSGLALAEVARVVRVTRSALSQRFKGDGSRRN